MKMKVELDLSMKQLMMLRSLINAQQGRGLQRTDRKLEVLVNKIGRRSDLEELEDQYLEWITEGKEEFAWLQDVKEQLMEKINEGKN